MRGATISNKMERTYNVTGKVMEALESTEGRLIQIESLVCFAALLLICLEIMGASRRCLSSGILRGFHWIAYNIPPYLIVYTLGLMNAAPFKNEHFFIWAAFLIILLQGADSFSAYTVEDNEKWQTYIWQYVFKLISLLTLSSLYFKISDTIGIAFICLYVTVSMSFTERCFASILGTKASQQRLMKLYADYYKRKEHLDSFRDEGDLTTMKGYPYLVGCNEIMVIWSAIMARLKGFRPKVEKAEAPEYLVPFDQRKPSFITIEEVWQCQGKLLREGDSDQRIKDLCLSYALFKILSSRWAGYTIPQEVHEKTWKLFKGIINSPDRKNGCERAFRIIEVELAFVFYQFYTRSHCVFYQPVKLLIMIICFGTVAPTIFDYRKPEDNVQQITSNGLNIDVIITMVVIFAVLFLGILHVILKFFSERGKVDLICLYVEWESLQKCKIIEKTIEFICPKEIPKLKPWERKLGQYSLLKSYGCLCKWKSTTELSTEVKLAVIDSLMEKGTNLENGEFSLRKNNMRKCLWACNLETQAQVVLVWHIATSMCEYKIPVSTESQSDTLRQFEIATSLSKYLAYLVAFAPRLLPGHPFITEYVFKQVKIEAREAFGRHSCLEVSMGKLMEIGYNEEIGETTIERGARLGKELLQEPGIVWKVLADFWPELILYMAPSNDMDAHVERLTMGGEFVTQIWALLWHSGIERDPPNKTPELGRSRSCPTA